MSETDEIARLTAERDMLRSMIETLTHLPPERLRGLNMLAAERDAARAQAAALAEALRDSVAALDSAGKFILRETGCLNRHRAEVIENGRAALAAYDAQKETGDAPGT
jgi:hypothetical protein